MNGALINERIKSAEQYSPNSYDVEHDAKRFFKAVFHNSVTKFLKSFPQFYR